MDDAVTVQEATTAAQPIPSYRPDAKTRRYDRQLRLWASSGQKSLESARVLVIGADATACQSLKNLVLPGISHFTIISPLTATAPDIATNFFLLPESFGSNMAEEACALLKELNPGVEGAADTRDPKELLESSPEFFLEFTLILGVNLEPAFELGLSDLLWEASNNAKRSPDIPLISVRNSGFIGTMRAQYREHCIVDTHPDNLHDLRIDSPFPALLEYSLGLDMESMDSMEHSHVPFVVLMIRALEEWKKEHDGKSPTYQDSEQFKTLLAKTSRASDEENYEEAASQAFKAAQKSAIPWGVRPLIEDKQCLELSKDSKNFWILVRALREYTLLPASLSLLPQSASLPDMKASTSFYVALQNLYKAKAREDVEIYKECLAVVLKEIGLELDAIEEEEIETFVKNCSYLTVCKGKSLRMSLETDVQSGLITGEIEQYLEEELEDQRKAEEQAAREERGEDEDEADDDDEDDGEKDPNSMPAMGYLIAFRASDIFYHKYGYYAGSDLDKSLENETGMLLEVAKEYLKGLGWMKALPKAVIDCVGEISRGGASTLPTTAAFLGGLVAQEAIKLVTSQYVPLNNTAVIDLIRGGIKRWTL